MPEQGAPPARYLVPPGDYQPPAESPRRPGSDHSYLPHSLESSPVTQADDPPDSTTEFHDASPAARRSLVLSVLRADGSATTAEIRQRLGVHPNFQGRLNTAIQELRRDGDIEGVPVPGGPAMRWFAVEKSDRPDPDPEDGAGEVTCDPLPEHPDHPHAATAQPQATHVPDPPGWTPPWQDYQHLPAFTPRLLDPTPAADVTRAAVDSDGRLLLWLDDGGLVETSNETARHLLRVLEINRPLLEANR